MPYKKDLRDIAEDEKRLTPESELPPTPAIAQEQQAAAHADKNKTPEPQTEPETMAENPEALIQKYMVSEEYAGALELITGTTSQEDMLYFEMVKMTGANGGHMPTNMLASEIAADVNGYDTATKNLMAARQLSHGVSTGLDADHNPVERNILSGSPALGAKKRALDGAVALIEGKHRRVAQAARERATVNGLPYIAQTLQAQGVAHVDEPQRLEPH